MGASRRHTIGYRASKNHRNPPIRVGGEPHTQGVLGDATCVAGFGGLSP
ncbi:hypothetical protein C4K39_1044 [Pseudomonas sessilinigenes]|nr:hypothetical protein C4K39_1044 [Pseudomonas sessilinigenes]